MELTFKDKLFCFAGRLHKMSAKMYTQGIHHRGGDVTDKLTSDVDFLIVGSNPGKRFDVANEMGIWIVEESPFYHKFKYNRPLKIAQHQVVQDTAPIDGLIGALRSALDGTPDHVTWNKIIDVVDLAEPNQARHLVDYLLAHMARWQIAPDFQWASLYDVSYQPSTFKHIPATNASLVGCLRIAPEHWMDSMKVGVLMPKFELIRGMRWDRYKLNGTFATKIIQNEHLCNLTMLNTGLNKISMTFLRALKHAPCASKLEFFKFKGLSERFAKVIVGEHNFPSLHTLGWGPEPRHRRYDDVLIANFFGASCFSEVNTFHLDGLHYSIHSFENFALPNVRHLHLIGNDFDFSQLIHCPTHKLFENIEVLSLGWDITGNRLDTRFFVEMLTANLSQIGVLDLSKLMAKRLTFKQRMQLFKGIASNRMGQSPGAVYLGDYIQYQEVVDVFDQHNIQLLESLVVGDSAQQ